MIAALQNNLRVKDDIEKNQARNLQLFTRAVKERIEALETRVIELESKVQRLENP